MGTRRSTRIVILTCLVCCAAARADDAVRLIDDANPKSNWSFGNGQEFKGATGSLSVDPDARHDGHEALKLVGDFSKGGVYVQAGRKIDKVDIRELSFWIRNPNAERFTMRLTDASGQAHQIGIKTEQSADWQHVVLPLERFFARRGEADAVTVVAKYESWGGAKDGNWHGPATGIYFIAGNDAAGKGKIHTMWLSDVQIAPRPMPIGEAATTVRLDEIVDGAHDWGFSTGGEVPGAKGSLSVVKDQPAAGETALKLAGDFTGGGAYVAAIKDLKGIDATDVRAFRINVRTDNAATVSVQVVDATGQTHQRKGIKLDADGQWHEWTIKPAEIAGGEHWAGAKDGKWHGPPTRLVVSVTSGSDAAKKQPVLFLSNVRAEAVVPVFARPAAFKADFEGPAALAAAEWPERSEGVDVDADKPFKGAAALRLTRTLDDVEKPRFAVSRTFAAAPGQWSAGLAYRSDLNSPDNSYDGVATLEALDAAGKLLERFVIADVFAKHEWTPISKQVELPKGVAAARFRVQLNKTHGSLWLDDISAAYVAPAPRRDDRVSRILFASARLGNLFFPGDRVNLDVSIEARKPLRDDQRTLTYVVRDYWGAEQTSTLTTPLGAAQKQGDHLAYPARIELRGMGLELGRYYEVHASVASSPGGEPFSNYTSLAILPEAETKKYKPEEIPFTSRNWDNRLTEYIRLSDRLGVRVCGVWGGWSAKPPYAPEAPNLDLVKELGMGWLTNTPVAGIERGETKYDETALRTGVRNLIEKFGQHRPMVINLGNEPHGTGAKVLRNVEAYRVVYEEIKKVDPTIPVVATSVEPNEEYFKAGYGKWCDAFDFHIYETAADVRRTMREYQAMMKKYGVEKPLWSTELGLNSQGLPRHVVAQEVTKKFVTFFATGGANVSWFGLLYPDAEGKEHGSGGDSHNVFDCRYNRYAPRLDAIAYYNAVNAIAIKKFVAEKEYDAGVHAFLFRDRDGHALQVLWKDKGRADVLVPLAGVKDVQVIRVDGSRRPLDAGGGGVMLSVTEDPLLLLYDGGPNALPDALGAPAMTLTKLPASVSRRAGEITITVAFADRSPGAVNLVAPPFWRFASSEVLDERGKPALAFRVEVPADTAAHQADFTVTIGAPGGARSGELYFRAPVGE